MKDACSVTNWNSCMFQTRLTEQNSGSLSGVWNWIRVSLLLLLCVSSVSRYDDRYLPLLYNWLLLKKEEVCPFICLLQQHTGLCTWTDQSNMDRFWKFSTSLWGNTSDTRVIMWPLLAEKTLWTICPKRPGAHSCDLILTLFLFMVLISSWFSERPNEDNRTSQTLYALCLAAFT